MTLHPNRSITLARTMQCCPPTPWSIAHLPRNSSGPLNRNLEVVSDYVKLKVSEVRSIDWLAFRLQLPSFHFCHDPLPNLDSAWRHRHEVLLRADFINDNIQTRFQSCLIFSFGIMPIDFTFQHWPGRPDNLDSIGAGNMAVAINDLVEWNERNLRGGL